MNGNLPDGCTSADIDRDYESGREEDDYHRAIRRKYLRRVELEKVDLPTDHEDHHNEDDPLF